MLVRQLGVTIFEILALLLVKHYICDFPLQRPWHYMNKGKYGHPGGLAHAAIHAAGTFWVLVWYIGPAAVWLAAFDMLAHYHIDWLKCNVGKSWSEYDPGNLDEYGMMEAPIKPHLAIYSDMYFQALGMDQLAHHMTYVVLVIIAGM